MARLFISYRHRDRNYAFAVRQWLIDEQNWHSEDIFVDSAALRAGNEWAERIFSEAERANAVLFIASEAALEPDSFCYKELQRARGVTIAVTLGGLKPNDPRLMTALPHGAAARQITQLDAQPTAPFAFISPIDGSSASVDLNKAQVASIGQTLRELGVAPDSFRWTPNEAGPYPGLRALQEGDEALFFGRDNEIRDCIREIENICISSTNKALIIVAPSGAGKSSFLRAGLWKRLRRHAKATPLCIVRARNDVIEHESWGLVAGLRQPDSNILELSYAELERMAREDLVDLLLKFADADRNSLGERRTLILGVDQAEELNQLTEAEARACKTLLDAVSAVNRTTPIRLILTARDDSVEDVLSFLEAHGLSREDVASYRLNQMSHQRFTEVIRGPARSAAIAGYKLEIDDELVVALSAAATDSKGKVGDALPILALALQRMIVKHRKPDGAVTLKVEDAQTFLNDSVARSAAEALRAAQASEDTLAELVVPQLVVWDPRAGESGAAKRRVANEAALCGDGRAHLRPLAESLVNQRLLTKTTTSRGAVYEVAHEALLRAQPLGGVITSMRAKFLKTDIMLLECEEWLDHGRTEERTARTGERLSEALELFNDPYFGVQLKTPTCLFETISTPASCATRRKDGSASRLKKWNCPRNRASPRTAFWEPTGNYPHPEDSMRGRSICPIRDAIS